MTNHIPDQRKEVSVFLLTVLQAVLNEQVKARQMNRRVADYVYGAVKDQCTRKGWSE
jgi:hypothetical protein